MSISTQLTTKSRKGFTNRFDYRLKERGQILVPVPLRTATYRLTTDSSKSSFVYDGVMWEFLSSSTRSYPTRQSWCVKSNKYETKLNFANFRRPTIFNVTLQELHWGSDNEAYLRSGNTLSVITGGFPETSNLNWNMGLWLQSNGVIIPDLNSIFRSETETLVKLKDMKVNFGEALAESRSTINHLAKTSKTLVKAFLYARRGKWSKLLRELKVNPKHKWSSKDPASRWLEVQFGWTPLLNDIKGAFELNQTILRKNWLLFAAERNIVSSYAKENLCTLSGERFRGSSCLFTGTRGVAVKIYARVQDEDIARLTSFGLTDPLQVAWALVPFSFVVDWILPIGSYLEALGAVKGLSFVSGTRTEFLNGSVDISSEYTTSTARGDGVFSKSGQVTAVRRNVYTHFPFPVPYTKSPFSTSHLISALALIRTIAFKR